jgi:peptidoglycan hydrolase CwlO-like protein
MELVKLRINSRKLFYARLLNKKEKKLEKVEKERKKLQEDIKKLRNGILKLKGQQTLEIWVD